MPKRIRGKEDEPTPKRQKNEQVLDLSIVPPEILLNILQNTDAKTVRTLGLYVPEIRESLKYSAFRKSLCEDLKNQFSVINNENIDTSKKVNMLLALAREYGRIHFFIKHKDPPMTINCIAYNGIKWGRDDYDMYTVSAFKHEIHKKGASHVVRYPIALDYNAWISVYKENVNVSWVKKHFEKVLNEDVIEIGFKMIIPEDEDLKVISDGKEGLIKKDKGFPRKLPLTETGFGTGIYEISAKSIILSDDLSYKFNAMCKNYE